MAHPGRLDGAAPAWVVLAFLATTLRFFTR